MPDTTHVSPPNPSLESLSPWYLDLDFPTDMHFKAHQRQTELRAKELLKEVEQDQERTKKTSAPVFSLDECMERIKYGPFDFTTILSINTQILNDFFEYQLRHAHEGAQPEFAINSALRAQSQLIRSVSTLMRHENFKNRGTN